MADSGILTEEDRVELIDGDVVFRSRISSRHLSCVNSLSAVLVRSLCDRAIVSVQNPVRLNDVNEPVPDLSILRPKKSDCSDALPTGKDVLIAIEVSDTTGVYDRTIKLPLYAANGVRESWIVDLKTRVIEVHSKPRTGRFTRLQTYGKGETAASTIVDGVALAVDEVIG